MSKVCENVTNCHQLCHGLKEILTIWTVDSYVANNQLTEASLHASMQEVLRMICSNASEEGFALIYGDAKTAASEVLVALRSEIDQSSQ